MSTECEAGPENATDTAVKFFVGTCPLSGRTLLNSDMPHTSEPRASDDDGMLLHTWPVFNHFITHSTVCEFHRVRTAPATEHWYCVKIARARVLLRSLLRAMWMNVTPLVCERAHTLVISSLKSIISIWARTHAQLKMIERKVRQGYPSVFVVLGVVHVTTIIAHARTLFDAGCHEPQPHRRTAQQHKRAWIIQLCTRVLRHDLVSGGVPNCS